MTTDTSPCVFATFVLQACASLTTLVPVTKATNWAFQAVSLTVTAVRLTWAVWHLESVAVLPASMAAATTAAASAGLVSCW
jgi:hypothetical protein